MSQTITQPLNKLLYDALVDRFGHVRVANDGQAASVSRFPEYQYRRGKLTAFVSDWGEVYKVCCPVCNDTRYRLCISHLFGTIDYETDEHLLSLLKCHNEHCIDTREKQKQFYAMLFPHGSVAREVQPLVTPPVTPVIATPRRIEMPPIILLSDLCDDHPAIEYLFQRGFNPTALSEVYGVGYCDVGRDGSLPAFERIVVPVHSLREEHQDGEKHRVHSLAGWQARWVGDDHGDRPKYLTAAGMKKSHLLYGLHLAVETTGPAVIVEGVTDAWSVGLHAVALFGKTISQEQIKLIVRWLSGRPVVVMLDADAADDAARVRDLVRRARHAADDRSPVVVATLPPDTDPGDLSREQLDAIVAAALQ